MGIWLWNFRPQADRLLFDDNEQEDDDENQENVNQGSDVHLRTGRKRTPACRRKCHSDFLFVTAESEWARAGRECLTPGLCAEFQRVFSESFFRRYGEHHISLGMVRRRFSRRLDYLLAAPQRLKPHFISLLRHA